MDDKTRFLENYFSDLRTMRMKQTDDRLTFVFDRAPQRLKSAILALQGDLIGERLYVKDEIDALKKTAAHYEEIAAIRAATLESLRLTQELASDAPQTPSGVKLRKH